MARVRFLAQQGFVQFGPHLAIFAPFIPQGFERGFEQPGFLAVAAAKAASPAPGAEASDVLSFFLAQHGFLQSGPHFAVPSGFLHGVLHFPAHFPEHLQAHLPAHLPRHAILHP